MLRLLLGKTYNKYDSYIFLLIASLVAGNLFGAFQVPRVLALLLFMPFMKCYPAMRKRLSNMRLCLMMFLMYSFVSCIWTPAGTSEGLITAVYNTVHVTFFLEIIVFSYHARNPIKAITCGFLVAFAISAVIAFWELTTDQHLDTSKTQEAQASNTGVEIYVRYFAAATFYNFNMYVTFLSLLFPFLFYGLSDKKNTQKLRAVYVVAATIAVVLILYNGSRGGFIAFLIMAIIYAFFSVSSVKRNISVYTILFVAFLTAIMYYYGYAIMNTLIMRGAMTGADFEEESRFAIWGNVLQVVEEYFFLGCGSGGLMYAMEKYAHGGVTVAHNLFLEVLSEYGLFFFIAYMVFLVGIFKKAYRMSNHFRRVCLYQALLSFPVVSIINSGYLTQPVLWATMASLYVFANYERIKPFHKSLLKAT